MRPHRPVVAFVLGGANCVWADLASAQQLCSPHIVVVVNDVGCDYAGRIDHWVSYHSDFLAKWSAKRSEKGLSPAGQFWAGRGGPTHLAPKGTKTIDVHGGSSGLLATFVAIRSKATRIILCGIPMDPKMRHYHEGKRGMPWTEATKYHKHWQEAADQFGDSVRSMSGWTSGLLGKPTKVWLES